MSSPSSRRARYAVIAVVAAGAIGVTYAGIASARSSSDEGTADRVAAIAPADVVADATTDPAATPETVETEPSATPSATVTPSAKPSPTPSKKATSKPATKRPTPTPTKKKTKTSKPTTPGGAGGGSATVTEVIRLVNVERKKAGCGSLAGESRLHAAAQKHSELQASKETMSHQLPGEASMGDRVTAQGYKWGGVAENVAAGYTTPASVMDGWMNSAGHKANILNCGYKHIGVGVKKSAKGTLYWTQNFASPR